MITLNAKISSEDLEKFNKETNSDITSDVVLSYAFNNLTNEYYLAFVNDLIVIHNDIITLNHGVVTPERLTYLETTSSVKTNNSELNNYFEEGTYIGKI